MSEEKVCPDCGKVHHVREVDEERDNRIRTMLTVIAKAAEDKKICALEVVDTTNGETKIALAVMVEESVVMPMALLLLEGESPRYQPHDAIELKTRMSSSGEIMVKRNDH